MIPDLAARESPNEARRAFDTVAWCRGMVLIVDSLQTARSRTSDMANDAKDRADKITAILKMISE